jgi:hemerythrin superfamily protein
MTRIRFDGSGARPLSAPTQGSPVNGGSLAYETAFTGKERHMPNVIELLNQDHRAVEQLFARFESTQDFDIALQICEQLTVHAAVEEEIVYEVLERVAPKIEREAEQEHAEAKLLISRIQRMSPGDPDLVPTMRTLQEGIEHHVEEEEGEAWPTLAATTTVERLEALGTEVGARKAELLRQLVGALPTMPTTGTAAASVRGTGSASFSGLTRDELYRLAQERQIDGRSTMKKDELIQALSEEA